MATRSYPLFFQILLSSSVPVLEIPYDFVSEYLKNKIPNDPIIRSANGEYSWQVKIEKVDGNYCFTQGWNNVCDDINLGYADFLLFHLVDQSTFKMSIYRPNGCELVLSPNPMVELNDLFFVSVITNTHKSMLRLPEEFVGLPGIYDEGTIKMKNLDGQEWEIGVRLDTKFYSERYYLSKGWPSFRKNNNLSEGDECVFKFIRNESKMCLAKVTKKEQAVTQPPTPPPLPHGTPTTEVVVKRPRERSPKNKSFSM